MQPSFMSKLQRRVEGTTNSLLAVGLDPMPEEIMQEAAQSRIPTSKPTQQYQTTYKQCCDVIDQTASVAAAFKPNIAFFEAIGVDGINLLQRVCAHIDPDVPILLDCKRGDIGHTAKMYAHAYYTHLQVDAVTVNPYMGIDAILPFLEDPRKAVFVLCKTSNTSARELQMQMVMNEAVGIHSTSHTLDAGVPLYIKVARMCKQLHESLSLQQTAKGAVGLVMGATDDEAVLNVRKEWKDVWLLTPGVGAQGGDLKKLIKAGIREDGKGLIIPISRAIYNSETRRKTAEDFHTLINELRHTAIAAFD